MKSKSRLSINQRLKVVKNTLVGIMAEYAAADDGHYKAERALRLIQDLNGLGPADGTLSQTEKDLALDGQKIPAIKEYRGRTGAGLKEAKDAVEAWMSTHPTLAKTGTEDPSF